MVRRDQVETPGQRCGRSEGAECRRLLVDAAQRMSPLAQKYVEDESQATQFRRGASDEPVEGLAERLETHWVVLQLGGANLGDGLDGEACARFSRWASGPTAAQLSKALRERWAASSPLVGAGVAVPHLPLAGVPVEAALVTLAAPLQGRPLTGCGRRRSWCCCRPSATAASPPASRTWRGSWRAASTPRSPGAQAGGRDRARCRARADRQGAQKRSTATPCSSPPGTGESSRCRTMSRPSSSHAVEATVPGWNQ
jgi:hypothetical protein